MTTRRSVLKKGVLGGALLILGGALPVALRGPRLGPAPREPLRLLSAGEHAVLAAVAARIVPGPTAPPGWPSAETVDCAGKADALLARVHPEVGAELKQLLRLFDNGLVSLVTIGRPTPFTRLDPAGQDARLQAWRTSRVALFRTGYQALARLAHATYHSSPEVQALVGYPGPPEVPQEAI
jgi:hypothetical protein